MSKNLKKWLSILLPILLGTFLIIYTYNSFTPDQIEKMKSYFVNANYNYIYLSLFLALFGYAFRAYRWRYTIEYLGYYSPFKTNLLAVCIAYFINMSIPRSGEVSRALVLNKYQGVPFDKGIGTIIAERVVDFFVLLLCIAVALFLEFDTLKAFLTERIPLQKLVLIGVVFIFCCITGILLLMYSTWKPILFIKDKISGLIDGVLSVFKMPDKWPFIIFTFLIWIVYILMFYVTIFALPETSHISFGVVVTAFVVGSLAIVFSNSGFGVYPFLIAKILELYGVSYEAGNAFGWIVWSSQILLIVILGGLSFLLLPIVHRKK